MEAVLGGQQDSVGGKLSVDTLDSARSLGESLRNANDFVRVGHGVGRGKHSKQLE